MATKLERIGMELEKARAKRDVWIKRADELEARYHKEENTVIHEMVHAANLTPEQLAQIIARAADGEVGPLPEGMTAGKTEEAEEVSDD